jgi:hypothetical protein
VTSWYQDGKWVKLFRQGIRSFASNFKSSSFP